MHVALHGDLGSTPVTQLPSRPEHFERGNTDSFRMVLPYVGTVQSLTVGHNNKGPGPEWHLEAVEVGAGWVLSFGYCRTPGAQVQLRVKGLP